MVIQTDVQVDRSDRVEPGPGRVRIALREASLVPVCMFAVVMVALCADVMAPHDPEVSVKTAAGRLGKSYIPPFWMKGSSLTTPLGTDFHSRDILSRLIYGARVSLLVGIRRPVTGHGHRP